MRWNLERDPLSNLSVGKVPTTMLHKFLERSELRSSVCGAAMCCAKLQFDQLPAALFTLQGGVTRWYVQALIARKPAWETVLK